MPSEFKVGDRVANATASNPPLSAVVLDVYDYCGIEFLTIEAPARFIERATLHADHTNLVSRKQAKER